ncbi:hypothetical protein QRX60_08305 [Amycolatopsis mongoliensis]|uniref:Uncharacterized protein n=1 Tax=Amycolatopsis mongoliensis TaxID=715475 RepID=A0A9Y2JSF0_9PSEU|nr:hypothetical protein [Amycolatopsis sp. 4-36]WIY03838.1 hypothetical protein QRX60_08305 [Amycolatopsis sp. 4-36]
MGEKPTDAETAEALLASGFLLEQRVALVLECRGYSTRIAGSYVDPDEGKPREIDVIGLKYIATDEQAEHPIAQIVVIECKSSPQTHVAFTRPWTPYERGNPPFELRLSKVDNSEAEKHRPVNPVPGQSYQVKRAWETLGLGDDWEVFRLNNIEKAVQIVRIEREGKGFKARNVLPEIGYPPIKAAFDLRRTMLGGETKSGRDGAIFPACVTGGDLKVVDPVGVDEVVLQDRDFVAVVHENRASWMEASRHRRSIFDVVPFVHLEKWLDHVDGVTDRLNMRVRGA